MRKPAVIRMWPFGGHTREPGQHIKYVLLLDPSPLSFPQRYSPLSPNAIPLSPPIIGPKTQMHNLRFEFCLTPDLCTSLRIWVNWSGIGR